MTVPATRTPAQPGDLDPATIALLHEAGIDPAAAAALPKKLLEALVALLTGQIVAFINHKPGSGKTNSAAWFAHAWHFWIKSKLKELAEHGIVITRGDIPDVELVDADESGHLADWEATAAAYDEDGERTGDGFPFAVHHLADPDKIVQVKFMSTANRRRNYVIDCNQSENRTPIAYMAAQLATVIFVPLAPTGSEASRTFEVYPNVLQPAMAMSGEKPWAVLRNRTVTNAKSTTSYKTEFEARGWPVTTTHIPRLEVYAQSWGTQLTEKAATGSAYYALVMEMYANLPAGWALPDTEISTEALDGAAIARAL